MYFEVKPNFDIAECTFWKCTKVC